MTAVAKQLILTMFFVALLSASAAAHGAGEVKEQNIGNFLVTTSVNSILIAIVITAILVIIALLIKEKSEKVKVALYLGILIPVVLATAYSVGSTVYINLISESQGPVHWHADFEIWNCGQMAELKEPEGFTNLIGSPTVHEHGDLRIHLEGVLIKLEDGNLHSFFEALGGTLTEEKLVFPAHDGSLVVINNGDACNGEPGKLQAFLYKIRNPKQTHNWVYDQTRLENFSDYVISPYSFVPPGDCIIIEFGEEKEKTERICETYRVSIEKGELKEGTI